MSEEKTSKIKWAEPVRTIKQHYSAELTGLKSGLKIFPNVVAINVGGHYKCILTTDDGRVSLTSSQPLDIENVPEKPKAVPLTDEQLELMAGKYICHRERLGNPVMVSSKPYPCVVVISSGQRLFTSKNLMDNFCWPPNKDTGVFDPINSHYPPTKPDYDSQYERLEVS